MMMMIFCLVGGRVYIWADDDNDDYDVDDDDLHFGRMVEYIMSRRGVYRTYVEDTFFYCENEQQSMMMMMMMMMTVTMMMTMMMTVMMKTVMMMTMMMMTMMMVVMMKRLIFCLVGWLSICLGGASIDPMTRTPSSTARTNSTHKSG